MNKSSVRWVAILALLLLLILPSAGTLAAPIGESAPVASDAEAGLVWNTFLGGTKETWFGRVVTDDEGNSYVAGVSSGAWGAPIRPFLGMHDVFVAKLDAEGVLIWMTFLGGEGSYSDIPELALDQDGFIYVAGLSWGAWSCLETPCTVRPYANRDRMFAAKLAPDGTLLWNTFMGGDETSLSDLYLSIAVSGRDTVYITGVEPPRVGRNPCVPTAL